MKLTVYADEWYAIYTIMKKRPDQTAEIEIPDELIERWRKCIVEFDAIQAELQILYYKQYWDATKAKKEPYHGWLKSAIWDLTSEQV